MLAVTAILLGASTPSSPTAGEQLATLRQQAHAARESGDKAARLQAVLKIQRLLNDSPPALESSAHAYSDAGDAPHALAALEQFAQAGQIDDDLMNGSDKTFAKLETTPQYKSLMQKLRSNKAAISKAEPVFTLADSGLVA